MSNAPFTGETPPLPPPQPAPPPMAPPPVMPYAPYGKAAGQARSSREQYNIVTDTIAGPNVRLRDNLLQAGAVVLGLVIGAGIGAAVAPDPGVGAAVGGVIGLVAGLLLSGFALMIFRMSQHARGKHE